MYNLGIINNQGEFELLFNKISETVMVAWLEKNDYHNVIIEALSK